MTYDKNRKYTYKDLKSNKTLTVQRQIIIYVENPKEYTDKLYELISKFNKVTR